MTGVAAAAICYGACVGDQDRLAHYVKPHIGGRELLAMTDQTSIAEAYNTILDAHRKTGGTDMLVLVHDDLEITDLDAEIKLFNAIGQLDVALVGVAGARGVTSLAWWEHDTVGHQATDATFIDFGPRAGEVDMLEGSLLAFSPWAIEHLRFDTQFPGFHGYDEIAMQARAAGKKVLVADVDTHHHTRLGFTTPDSERTWQRCNDLFRQKWGFA